MGNKSMIAMKMFQALSEEGINIQMISTSEIKISCLIDLNIAEKAIKAIHNKLLVNGIEIFKNKEILQEKRKQIKAVAMDIMGLCFRILSNVFCAKIYISSINIFRSSKEITKFYRIPLYVYIIYINREVKWL